MQLTIITETDKTFFIEIDSEMELGDLLALIGAEADEDPSSIELSFNGKRLGDQKQTLASYGMTGKEEMVTMSSRNAVASTSSNAAAGVNPSASSVGGPNSNDVERMRLQMLGDPAVMNQLRAMRPELYDAVMTNPQRFAQLMQQEFGRRVELEQERKQQEALLNSDPYDVDAQRKIEEAIRQQAVLENMEHAMEYAPESFGNVIMLYIDVEVNGHKVKAFVDSGAQSTIISPECAEKCGLMRLLDTRFSGVARGVGTAKILGRIHSAQIKLNDLHLPVGFSVLEGRDVDLLFGLDMLKRHQACIDLEKNCLRIQGREIRFLSEHELPAQARHVAELAGELDNASAAGLPPGGVATSQPHAATAGAGAPSGSTGSSASTAGRFPGSGQALGSTGAVASSPTANAGPTTSSIGTSGASFPEADLQALINLGATREQAKQTLEAAGGNVDVAASLLFSNDF